MLKFVISRKTKIEREKIFALSVNIEQFSNLMPRYFKSLKITKKVNANFFVDEEISFFSKGIKVKTKHVVKNPNIHEIHILSGPLKNSSFIENYEKSFTGTDVTIIINLNFNGIFKLFYLFNPLIEKRVNKIMDEFISACELKNKNPINYKIGTRNG